MIQRRIIDLLLGVLIGILIAALLVFPQYLECRDMLGNCFATTEKVMQDWHETLDLVDDCLDLLEQYNPPDPQAPGSSAHG